MKNIGPIVLTENEKLLLNSALSMLGGAVVGTIQGTYQYLTQGGNVSLNGAMTFALGGFLTLMGIALKTYIPAHAQQMIADAEARATELEQALHLATTAQPVVVPSIQPTPVAAPVSPVTIHFNGVPMQVDTNTTAHVLNTAETPTPIVLPVQSNAASMTAIQTAPSVQLTMSPAPSIASTPDLSSEDTAVRKSVTIV